MMTTRAVMKHRTGGGYGHLVQASCATVLNAVLDGVQAQKRVRQVASLAGNLSACKAQHCEGLTQRLQVIRAVQAYQPRPPPVCDV